MARAIFWNGSSQNFGLSCAMKEVVPDVWVGKPPSSDVLGSIQAVISCALDPCPTSLAELNVPVDDAPEAPIFLYFAQAHQFLSTHVQRKEPVLVYCESGRSCSVTVCLPA